QIADCKQLAAIRRPRFFRRIAIARRESRRGFYVDASNDSGRELVAVVVEDAKVEPGKRFANASRFFKPLVGRDHATHTLARAVVLPDRALGKHAHDAPLDRRGTGCGTVDDAPNA